jgi:type I restriction enzyme S subunit
MKNDIMIAMTDMKNNVAILANTARIRDDDRFVVNQRVGRLRVSRPESIDPVFLYYYSNWRPHIDYLRSRANSGVQVNLSTSAIKQAKITIPPLIQQQAIASILGSLDDKIELNRRMNETLEAMARALFISWFVDFDPVSAKAEDRDTGLPKPIADLFPARFIDSELGEIPEGWNTSTIEELASIVGGSTPSTANPAYWQNGQHYWATPKDLSALSTPVLLETERRITDVGVAQISSGMLPVGTVLLSSRAPIGYLAIAQVPVAINQGFIAMVPAKHVSNLFLVCWAKWAHNEIVSRANGSTFLEISKTAFRPIPVVRSPDMIFQAFDRLVAPLFGRIVSNEREARTVAALRDALLPKLISGELRVKKAEQVVAEAAA